MKFKPSKSSLSYFRIRFLKDFVSKESCEPADELARPPEAAVSFTPAITKFAKGQIEIAYATAIPGLIATQSHASLEGAVVGEHFEVVRSV